MTAWIMSPGPVVSVATGVLEGGAVTGPNSLEGSPWGRRSFGDCCGSLRGSRRPLPAPLPSLNIALAGDLNAKFSGPYLDFHSWREVLAFYGAHTPSSGASLPFLFLSFLTSSDLVPQSHTI
jgi:hypothetical protein